LDKYSIILTPHQLAPEKDAMAILDNEIASLNYGTYNSGFLAIRNDHNGHALADWWRDRLLKYCHDDLPAGPFTDQKWLNLVPSMFDNVHILRDPGYNVASWNLSNRKVKIHNSSIYVNDIFPLRFYHYTELGPAGRAMAEHYAKDDFEVFELWANYEEMVIENKMLGLPENWWFYGAYSDGTVINKEDRVRYRKSAQLQKKHPNPFTARKALHIPFTARKALHIPFTAHISLSISSEDEKISNPLGRFLEKNTRTIRRLFTK